MTIVLCQDGARRHGGGALVAKLADRDLDVSFVECFDKCDTCERRVIARIDGASVAVKTAEELLEMVDKLLEDG